MSKDEVINQQTEAYIKRLKELVGPDVKIPVCDACHRSCCVQGTFMCEDAIHAGIEQLNITELELLWRFNSYEHPSYWVTALASLGHLTNAQLETINKLI